MTSRCHFRPAPLSMALAALLVALPSSPALGHPGVIHAPLPHAETGVVPEGAAIHPTDGPDADVRIWIEEGAIRWRVEANLAFADAMVDAPRELEDQVAEVEREDLARALFEAYSEHNRVTVDGVQLDPVMGEWRFVDALEEFLPLFPLNGARALIRMRVEYSYPLLSPPQRVAMVWGLYPVDTVQRLGPDGPKIEVSAQLNAGGFDYPLLFTEAEPEYIWHGELPTDDEVFLPVPGPAPPPGNARFFWALYLGGAALALGSIAPLRRGKPARGAAGLVAGGLCAWVGFVQQSRFEAASLPAADEALAIFTPLHQNIYRAFRFDDESRIYDALERSVDGALLEKLYGQIYRSLVNEDEGGAVSRVEEVRHEDVTVADIGVLDDGRQAFGVDARWQVDGAVIHWGHAHRRTQEYTARYALAETDNGWRIVGSEVLEQRVVASTPGVEEEIGDGGGGPAFVAPANREL